MAGDMSTTRLEAFSDAVIAIIMTIMVLELPVPHGFGLEALKPVLPVLLSYVMSFVYLGIYWNNHHHMMHVVSRVNGNVLWANMHLLFWLSLVPFVTGWMGESHVAPVPTAMYGLVLFMAAVAFSIMEIAVLRMEGPDSLLKKAVGRGRKEKVSLACYATAPVMAFVSVWIAIGLYVAVALLWLLPDPRVESLVGR